MRFTAAIFDLDGTLLDSTGMWDKIDADFLGRRGFAVPEDYAQAICALSFPETAEYTIRRFGLTERPEAVMAEWSRMSEAEYRNSILLKDGARDYILRLRAAGVRLAVATTLTRELFEPCLSRNGIFGCFEAFFSAGADTCGKTGPEIFLRAARALDAPPEACVVFEDILPAVRSAKRAGMRVCGVADAASSRESGAIRAAADWYITDYASAPLPE